MSLDVVQKIFNGFERGSLIRKFYTKGGRESRSKGNEVLSVNCRLPTQPALDNATGRSIVIF